MADTFQEQDGSTSSRRVAAFIFPSILYFGAIFILIYCALSNTAQWPVIGGLGLAVLGAVLQLWLFNLINKTDLQEIISKAMPKAGA